MSTQLVAYHGKAELKDQVLAIMAEHEAQDRVLQGTYAEFNGGGKFKAGCAVGCTLETLRRIEGLPEIQHNDHALYERYLGVPTWLARLEDAIFERLPVEDAKTWPGRFAAAIRPGADLSMVMPRFLYWLLSNPDGGVQAGVRRRPAIGPSVQAVIDLYGRWMDGVKPEVDEWIKARRADAYAYAAASAAYADAAYADAADAADAAYAAAAYAAYAADAADAADAAADAADARWREGRQRETQQQAAMLLTLLMRQP